MKRDWIVPGHPVGDRIPDVGTEVGPFYFLACLGWSEQAAALLDRNTQIFIRECEHAGVLLVPFETKIRIGKYWKAFRSFRVVSTDSSRFMCDYQSDMVEQAMAYLKAEAKP